MRVEAAHAAGHRHRRHRAVLDEVLAQGVDYAPRLAARLNTGLASDCIAIEIADNDKFVFTRPIYASKAIAKVSIDDALPQMATLRPNVFKAQEPDTSKTAQVEKLQPPIEGVGAKVVEFVKQESTRPELTEEEPENYVFYDVSDPPVDPETTTSQAVLDAKDYVDEYEDKVDVRNELSSLGTNFVNHEGLLIWYIDELSEGQNLDPGSSDISTVIVSFKDNYEDITLKLNDQELEDKLYLAIIAVTAIIL